jgi:hypothetical protein
MIRLFTILLFACVSAFAQVPQLYSVADQFALAQLTPGGIQHVSLRNGFGEFKWDGTSAVATNTNSVFQASGISTGRWVRITASTKNIPTIYVTDPQFGAVGDYGGAQNTIGSGTDNRAAIQAALDAAYTQGVGGIDDLTGGNSYRVVVPKGKYYISARSDGLPSLSVPLKVELDFSEAELHFDIPPTNDFGHGILEPNPLWCAIKMGNMAGLKVGKLELLPKDLTYGGGWYGLHMDAIRVQEADISWIKGAGREHYILGFTRGAAIRYIACLNSFVSDLNLASDSFGIVSSYFGTAYSGYTRYRGTSTAESVSVALWVHNVSFVNIFKKGIMVGVDGDYHTPAAGGFENVTAGKTGGGPVSVVQCPFENIGEEVVYNQAIGGFYMSDIRIERSGWQGSGSATIISANSQSFSLKNVTWYQQGGTCLQASYTGPLATITPNPGVFARLSSTDISPELDNVMIDNTASSSCQLINGTPGITRLPTIINFRANAATQMQGTNSYMPVAPPNGGGGIWSVSTVGLSPLETPNGSITNFSFVSGFTPKIPSRLQIDGAMWNGTNANGSVNWVWDTTNLHTMTIPLKDVRAFF